MFFGLRCVVCTARLWYCQAVHGALVTLIAVQAAVHVRQAAVLQAYTVAFHEIMQAPQHHSLGFVTLQATLA